MFKRFLGPVSGALIGGLIGHSQLLCFGGQCMLTGSWLGGTVLGAVVGYLLFPGIDRTAEPTPQPVPVKRDDRPR